jgi:hypothetical protein
MQQAVAAAVLVELVVPEEHTVLDIQQRALAALVLHHHILVHQ